MPSAQTYREYAMSRGQIVDWSQFVAENDWAKIHKYSDLPIVDKTVAIYYAVDKESKSVTERVSVTTYDAKYKNEFRDLNLKWVAQFFEVEEFDTYQLGNPEEAIINKGGEIFFLITSTGVVAGTVSDMVHSGDCELAKMTVRDECTGKGYANILMRESIKWADDRKYPYMKLYSSVSLENAIKIYKKFGFETIHLGPHPLYKRCSIVMQLNLEK
ncbi:unnamed protein product [Mucor hiemalis]